MKEVGRGHLEDLHQCGLSIRDPQTQATEDHTRHLENRNLTAGGQGVQVGVFLGGARGKQRLKKSAKRPNRVIPRTGGAVEIVYSCRKTESRTLLGGGGACL